LSLGATGNRDLWVTCSSTDELVSAVKHFVKPGQNVAEVGSQLRGVSKAICTALQDDGNAVLVDVQRKAPKTKPDKSSIARTKEMRFPGDEVDFFPNVAEFHEIPNLDSWKRVFLESTTIKDFEVLVLDVNSIVGNDLELTSLSIIREFVSLVGQSCEVVLVKSAALKINGQVD